MAKFQIELTERRQVTFRIEAETALDAIAAAGEMWREGLVLTEPTMPDISAHRLPVEDDQL